jgi:hypothetical protein
MSSGLPPFSTISVFPVSVSIIDIITVIFYSKRSDGSKPSDRSETTMTRGLKNYRNKLYCLLDFYPFLKAGFVVSQLKNQLFLFAVQALLKIVG